MNIIKNLCCLNHSFLKRLLRPSDIGISFGSGEYDEFDSVLYEGFGVEESDGYDDEYGEVYDEFVASGFSGSAGISGWEGLNISVLYQKPKAFA